MSKLIDLINAVPTGRVEPQLQPLDRVLQVSEEYPSLPFAREYRISCTFGAKVVVNDENLAYSTDRLKYAIRQVKQNIVEAVFGEFRPDFRRIQTALYSNNPEEASRLLQELEDRMFKV